MIARRPRGLQPALISTVAATALLAAGCGSTPPDGSATTPPPSVPTAAASSPSVSAASPSTSAGASTSGSPSGSASGSASTGASASGSASASPSATSTAAVRRGTDTGDDEVDVLVTVAYRSGKVVPTAPEVQVGPGERVKLIVTSDVSADIVVSGDPDASADVDPGEAEDIDFTVKGAGTTTVTLRQPKVVLATFVTG